MQDMYRSAKRNFAFYYTITLEADTCFRLIWPEIWILESFQLQHFQDYFPRFHYSWDQIISSHILINLDCENDKFGKYKAGCQPSAQKIYYILWKLLGGRERGIPYNYIDNVKK